MQSLVLRVRESVAWIDLMLKIYLSLLYVIVSETLFCWARFITHYTEMCYIHVSLLLRNLHFSEHRNVIEQHVRYTKQYDFSSSTVLLKWSQLN